MMLTRYELCGSITLLSFQADKDLDSWPCKRRGLFQTNKERVPRMNRCSECMSVTIWPRSLKCIMSKGDRASQRQPYSVRCFRPLTCPTCASIYLLGDPFFFEAIVYWMLSTSLHDFVLSSQQPQEVGIYLHYADEETKTQGDEVNFVWLQCPSQWSRKFSTSLVFVAAEFQLKWKSQ